MTMGTFAHGVSFLRNKPSRGGHGQSALLTPEKPQPREPQGATAVGMEGLWFGLTLHQPQGVSEHDNLILSTSSRWLLARTIF